jgi:SagB-type dehydrogenase family enzyme
MEPDGLASKKREGRKKSLGREMRKMPEKWIWMAVSLFWMVGFFGVSMGHGATRLPPPKVDGKVSVEKAIKERRTIRDFRERPLSFDFLSQLLWAAQGVTNQREGKRAVPSGGALYPLDIYVVVGEKCVGEMEPGIYHYLPEEHSISLVMKGDRRKEVALASLGQMWMGRAPVMFVITAEYRRITGKYGERGIRYGLMEAGHTAQNLFLQAESLGLGAGIVGAFDDGVVAKVMGTPAKHEPLLIVPVGYKK